MLNTLNTWIVEMPATGDVVAFISTTDTPETVAATFHAAAFWRLVDMSPEDVVTYRHVLVKACASVMWDYDAAQLPARAHAAFCGMIEARGVRRIPHLAPVVERALRVFRVDDPTAADLDAWGAEYARRARA